LKEGEVFKYSETLRKGTRRGSPL